MGLSDVSQGTGDAVIHIHAWQVYETVRATGCVDMRAFGGSERMDTWQLWSCLGCDGWGFANEEGHLLRMLSAEDIEKTDEAFYALAPLRRMEEGKR